MEELLNKLKDKFTKANMYAVLTEMEKGETNVTVADIAAIIKPQKGSASQFPPQEREDGTYYYCRYKQDYVHKDDMNFSGEQCKGTSILASKVAYRIQKRSDELKAEALTAFTKGDYQLGAEKNAEADRVLAMIDDASTFTDEAMAVSEFHPDFGKQTKEDKSEPQEIV